MTLLVEHIANSLIGLRRTVRVVALYEQTQRSTLPPWPKVIFQKLLAAHLSLPPLELQQAMEETNSNRSSPSSVANSPNHDEEDELFPLSSAAEVARLPLLDSTVVQRELAEIRSWIASEKCIIVCEMKKVASVMIHGDRTYTVKNWREVMEYVRDADAHHMVGLYAIFYRSGEE